MIVVTVERSVDVAKAIRIVYESNVTLLNEVEIGAMQVVEAFRTLLDGRNGTADGVLSGEFVLSDGYVSIHANGLLGSDAANDDLNFAVHLSHNGENIVCNGDICILACNREADTDLIIALDLAGAAESLDKLDILKTGEGHHVLDAAKEHSGYILNELGNGVGKDSGDGLTDDDSISLGYPYVVGNIPLIVLHIGLVIHEIHVGVEIIDFSSIFRKSGNAEGRKHKSCKQYGKEFPHFFFSFILYFVIYRGSGAAHALLSVFFGLGDGRGLFDLPKACAYRAMRTGCLTVSAADTFEVVWGLVHIYAHLADVCAYSA